MAHLLFVRPADDNAASHIAYVGQAVRGLVTAFTNTDLHGPQADRIHVDAELANATSLFYFGHGSPTALVANGADLVDQQNVGTLGGGIVVAIACHASVTFGPQAVQTPAVSAFLSFDDEFGFPLLAPLPMAMAVINGLRGLLTQNDNVDSAKDELIRQFGLAKLDYRANGPSYGLNTSDARTAWLYAKSNKHSVCLDGDTSAKL